MVTPTPTPITDKISNALLVLILGGPNKLELAHALLDSSMSRPFHVSFKCQASGDLPFFANVHVDQVQREDGSGDNFNIDGRIDGEGTKVRIFFTTKRRNHADCGTVTLAK